MAPTLAVLGLFDDTLTIASLKLLSNKWCFYTCDKQVLWESAGAFFSARQLSDFTRQLARFTRSWSSGKMLAFQPRGFVFEPVGMR